MQNIYENCAHCGEESKCRRRDFSEQAWTVLVVWNEIQTATVDRPVCDDCYGELREVLIDRADEIEAALRQPQQVKKPAAQAKKQQPAAKSKVRKAG